MSAARRLRRVRLASTMLRSGPRVGFVRHARRGSTRSANGRETARRRGCPTAAPRDAGAAIDLRIAGSRARRAPRARLREARLGDLQRLVRDVDARLERVQRRIAEQLPPRPAARSSRGCAGFQFAFSLYAGGIGAPAAAYVALRRARAAHGEHADHGDGRGRDIVTVRAARSPALGVDDADGLARRQRIGRIDDDPLAAGRGRTESRPSRRSRGRR